MRIASVAEVKARLSSYLKASATGPVVVTRNGKAVAVLLGVENDEELERLLLAHSRKLRAILDAADRRIDEGKGIRHDEFWQQVESANRAREQNQLWRVILPSHFLEHLTPNAFGRAQYSRNELLTHIAGHVGRAASDALILVRRFGLRTRRVDIPAAIQHIDRGTVRPVR